MPGGVIVSESGLWSCALCLVGVLTSLSYFWLRRQLCLCPTIQLFVYCILISATLANVSSVFALGCLFFSSSCLCSPNLRWPRILTLLFLCSHIPLWPRILPVFLYCWILLWPRILHLLLLCSRIPLWPRILTLFLCCRIFLWPWILQLLFCVVLWFFDLD